MDELQPELDPSGSPVDPGKEASLAETEDQFQSGTGQQTVAYRVLQVAEGDDQGLITADLPAGTQVAQAVLSSPFSGGGSGTNSGGAEGSSDGTFAYIPASSVSGAGDGDAAVVTNLGSQGGQFYVMMSPQDVIQGNRSATRISQSVGGGKYGSNRDERRRTTHNEVERRRRDKINNWIVALSKLIPDCAETTASSSAVSKSGILSKACEYIQDLKNANLRLAESLKESDHLTVENEVLRQQLEQTKDENMSLRRTLEQNGLETAGFPTAPPDAQ